MTTALTAETRLDDLAAVRAMELVQFARAIGAIDRKVSDTGALAMLAMARELRVPALGCLQKMSYINGKVYMEAELRHRCAEEVYGDKLRLEFPIETDDKCTGRISTDGGKTWNEKTWTYAQAQRAGLTSKDNWKRYPTRMLVARVKGWLLRDFTPKAGFGLYDSDEAPELQTIPHRDITSAEAIEKKLGVEPADDAPISGALEEWRLAIEGADDRDAIEAYLRAIAEDDRLSDEERETLRTVAVEKARKEGWKR